VAPAATPARAKPTVAPGRPRTAAPPPSPAATETGDREPSAGSLPLLACNDPLVPLGKDSRLAPDCVPAGLVRLPDRLTTRPAWLIAPAAEALVSMIAAAEADGLVILVDSSYRSFAEQAATFAYWSGTMGVREAERVSARAGHSEHQLGTTVDLTSPSVGYRLTQDLEASGEGRWLAENAWRWGFLMSYPRGMEHITGYSYEPWHLRWVTVAVAAHVRASGLTLHEYLRR
jgi:D-alanyl-D-alanine carboxypeptidase